jgi:hypothetical protein
MGGAMLGGYRDRYRSPSIATADRVMAHAAADLGSKSSRLRKHDLIVQWKSREWIWNFASS